MDNKIKCFSSVHHCGSYLTHFERFCQVFKKFVLSLGILLHRVLYRVSTILLLLVIGLSLCTDFVRLHRWGFSVLLCLNLPCPAWSFGVFWFNWNSNFSNGPVAMPGLFWSFFWNNYIGSSHDYLCSGGWIFMSLT